MFTTIGGAAANPSQIAENLPASLVGLASAMMPKKPVELKPKYGLVMQFKVTVDGMPLGNWSSCQGLRVDFKPVEVKSGGEYTTMRYLPGEMIYPKIVLKRAVDRENAKKVQDWLQKAAEKWIRDGSDPANSSGPGGAHISIYDPDGKPVMSWRLHGVRPAAWIGPDLDANQSKVAIETLELVHEGFDVIVPGSAATPPAPSATPGLMAKPQKLSLTGSDDNQVINFLYNPERVGIARSTETVSLATTEGSNLQAGERADVTVLTLNGIKIFGPDTKPTIEQLITWATKRRVRVVIGAHRAGDQLQPLALSWGELKHDVTIKSISGTYTRFDPDGKPVRAEVTLSLIVLPPAKKKTNPSSGGIPGRSAHQLVSDDNLPLLAFAQYGSPARWRDIAEANGIEDPLRLRPGDRIYLPAPSELALVR